MPDLMTEIQRMIDADNQRAREVECEFNQFFAARFESLLDENSPIVRQDAENLKDIRTICFFVWREAARKYGPL